MAGLLAGVLLGAALQSWLRVDIVPIGVSVLPPLHYALKIPVQLRPLHLQSGG